MSESQPPDEPAKRDQRDEPGETRHEGLFWRVLRSTIAPDVLEDGGRDAPLTARGRFLFWGTVAALVLAISILFVITLASK